MAIKNKKALVIVLLLSLSCFINFAYIKIISSQKQKNITFDSFPDKIDDWVKQRDIEISDDTRQILNPDAILIRHYMNSVSESVIVTIIYHNKDRYGAHTPHTCYKGQGWKIICPAKRQIEKVKVKETDFELNKFYAEKNDLKEVVFYWYFSPVKEPTASRFRQMIENIWSKLTLGNTGYGFVMLAMPLNGNDGKKEDSAVKLAEKISSIIFNF